MTHSAAAVVLAVAISAGASMVPRVELPASFSGDRVFAVPRLANADRRLVLWIDTGGGGFLRAALVNEEHLQTVTIWNQGQPAAATYLPLLGEREFPPVTGNHGALPVLREEQTAGDPIFEGLDGQLGWSWLDDRIWTIDYVGHHLYLDHAAPPFRSADSVTLQFDRLHRFPELDVSIEGTTYRAALDTAATIALSPGTLSALNDGLPQVRATSFVVRRMLDGWHSAHPDWTYIAQAGMTRGVSMIRVPLVRADRVTFRDVWFSSRPDDDVFQGGDVQMKLGPSAFHRCVVTVDYVHGAAVFACESS